MNASFRIVLIVGLVLAALPHAFCTCPSDQAAEPAACPHCDGGSGDRPADRPEPCQCSQCESVSAVLPSPPATVRSMDSNSRLCLAPVAMSVQCAFAVRIEMVDGAEPLGLRLPYGCALPILLGHLLL